MLSSIHPLGERARHSRWTVTVATYLVGSTAGGAVTGLAAGSAGAALMAVAEPRPAVVAGAVVVMGLAGAGLDVRWGRMPSLRRQVNEEWLARYRGWVYGIGFGFQLGLGFATVVTSATVYAAFALAFLVGSPVGGLTVGALFGATRGVAILTMRRVTTPERLRSAHRRMSALAPAAAGGAITAQLFLAAAAGAVFVV